MKAADKDAVEGSTDTPKEATPMSNSDLRTPQASAVGVCQLGIWKQYLEPTPLMIHVMSVTMPKKEIGLIIDKLDQVRLEILGLRATLIL